MPYGERRFTIASTSSLTARSTASDGAPRRSRSSRGRSPTSTRADGTLRELGIDVRIWPMPVEVPDPIRFEDDTHASLVRSRRRARASGGSCSRSKPVFERVPQRVHRQVQPGAFLLGQLRSGGDAFLGPPRARAAGRRCDHARGVLARGDQPRLLARQRRRCPSRRSTPTPRRSRPASKTRRSSRPRRSTARDFDEFILPYEAVRTAGVAATRDLTAFLRTTYDAGARRSRQWDRDRARTARRRSA